MAISTANNGYLARPQPSGLADVIDLILDKGLVIDVYVRVSLVGIELLTIDARIVVASVDTYLRFAEAVGRLNIEADGKPGLPELVEDVTSGGARSRTRGVVEAAQEKLQDALGDDSDEEEYDDEDEYEEEEEEEEEEREPAHAGRSRGRRRGDRR